MQGHMTVTHSLSCKLYIKFVLDYHIQNSGSRLGGEQISFPSASCVFDTLK